jgi:hypothetical protein
MSNLTVRESDLLRSVRELIARKPDDVLKFLAGSNPPTKALVALALSAHLEVTKQKLAGMNLTIALCEFLKGGETKCNDQ